jgi:hypothetical protein
MPKEQRKWPRKSVGADGLICATDGSPIGPCQVEDDVSVGGAKLTHLGGKEVPAQLVLLLSRNGQVRRHCLVAWRSKNGILGTSAG